MAAVDGTIVRTVKRMKDSASSRDASMDRVRLVRDGDFQSVWPDKFSEAYPNAITANFVDVAARDVASNLSPLPSLRCAAGSMRTATDYKKAEKKNRIGFNYWVESMLEYQMKYGADQYLTYGFLPVWVEADYKRKLPIIHVEDPQGAYYELDRWLKCRHYARVWRQDINELAVQFPDEASRILTRPEGKRELEQELEVVRYIDETNVILYLPERANTIVAGYSHGLDFTPVHIAVRPGLHMNPRGVFDDVLFVQMAHQMMAALTLEAGHKAVQAPLVVPPDINELNIGPDAMIVTEHGAQSVGRVGLNVPQAAFQLGEQLQQEMKEGAGYPDTRLGNGPAGGSTGRGISALEGGFDQQISLGQAVLGLMLKSVTQMCFAIDVSTWPNLLRKISGTISGESFDLTYKAARDIGDITKCDVTYGFAAGASPSSAIVTLLQLRGDGVITRDTFRRQLPFDIDSEHEQRGMDVQEMEDAFKQGIASSLSATGQMMASGQAAQAQQLFKMAHDIIVGRQNGVPLADLISQAMQPDPNAQQQGAPGATDPNAPPGAGGGGAPGGPPGPPGGPGGDLGFGPGGLPDNTAPGQAGQPPGGRPTIQDLTAGFSASGHPGMAATVRRRIATG